MTYYLDHMARHWDALLTEDYRWVMPLTWNRKYGFFYLYQPPGCANLGVFGSDLPAELFHRFLSSLPQKFRLVEIDLNSGNYFPDTHSPELLRNNYWLSLSSPIRQLRLAYRENTRRNIRRAQDAGCILGSNLPASEAIRLYRASQESKSNFRERDYRHFEELAGYLQARGMAEIRCVHDASGRLLSSAIFFLDHRRIYYIMAGNHPLSRDTGASHFLLDAYLEEKAGKNLVMDFEGSDMAGLAFFYSGFGGQVEHYPAIRLDHLPAWIRMLRAKNQKRGK